MKSYKKEQSKEQKVKRVLIEREDGTIAYDGKPDLCVFYAANADKKTFDSMIVTQINEKANVCIIKDAIDHIEKMIPKLACAGIAACMGEKK